MPIILSEDAVIVDSHVHIWRESDLDKLTWQTPSNPLYTSHDLKEYLSNLPPSSNPSRHGFRGFVFIEADRKYTDPASPSEDDEAWKEVLGEYEYVANLAKQHNKDNKDGLILGIVPWAPVHLGRDALERYKRKLEGVERRIFGHVLGDHSGMRKLLVGVRYLLQDKPDGVCLDEKFLEGMRWLKEQNLVFDLGIDVNRRGVAQLEEAVKMVRIVESEDGGPNRLKIAINHLTKPPLGSSDSTEDYKKWLELIRELSTYPGAFVKFSGGFSEMPESFTSSTSSSSEFPYDQLVSLIQPYANPILDAFGPNRILWGSDWPVCGIGYSKIAKTIEGSWEAWAEVTRRYFEKYLEGKNAKDWEVIAGWNAIKFYELEVSLS